MLEGSIGPANGDFPSNCSEKRCQHQFGLRFGADQQVRVASGLGNQILAIAVRVIDDGRCRMAIIGCDQPQTTFADCKHPSPILIQARAGDARLSQNQDRFVRGQINRFEFRSRKIRAQEKVSFDQERRS